MHGLDVDAVLALRLVHPHGQNQVTRAGLRCPQVDQYIPVVAHPLGDGRPSSAVVIDPVEPDVEPPAEDLSEIGKPRRSYRENGARRSRPRYARRRH